jgi:tetratricopeptide (TPR) repeat protein
VSRLDKLMKLREADEGDADVAYMIAQEHAKAGDHEEALGWYDEALRLDASYHYAYFHKARSLEALERTDEAAGVLETGLGRAKRDGNAKATGEIEAYLGELRA